MCSAACRSSIHDTGETDIFGGREQGCCNAKQIGRYPTEGDATRKGRKKGQGSLEADELILSTQVTSSMDFQKCSRGYLPR